MQSDLTRTALFLHLLSETCRLAIVVPLFALMLSIPQLMAISETYAGEWGIVVLIGIPPLLAVLASWFVLNVCGHALLLKICDEGTSQQQFVEIYTLVTATLRRQGVGQVSQFMPYVGMVMYLVTRNFAEAMSLVIAVTLVDNCFAVHYVKQLRV